MEHLRAAVREDIFEQRHRARLGVRVKERPQPFLELSLEVYEHLRERAVVFADELGCCLGDPSDLSIDASIEPLDEAIKRATDKYLVEGGVARNKSAGTHFEAASRCLFDVIGIADDS
jgi:hypothetical protein